MSRFLASAGALFVFGFGPAKAADIKTTGTGANVSFSVSANGSDPLTYQWNKDGVAIPGATASSYSITFAQPSDSGNYTVTATNSYGSLNSDSGQLTILAAPANDFFGTSTILSGANTMRRDVTGSATREAGEPLHAGIVTGAHSVWWGWTAPASATYTIDTIGSSFDTVLGVYTGANFSNLVTVASDDDIGGTTLTSSSVTFAATIGTTYWIAVDGKNAASGDVVLRVTNRSLFLYPYTISNLYSPPSQNPISNPYATAVDSSGNVYVADKGSNCIFVITAAGALSTYAGTSGSTGSSDGTGSAARFNAPSGIAVDSNGIVYVADTGNHTIRRIASGGVVTTLAGTAGSSGSLNAVGSAARFSSPMGVAVDPAGNVYVADTGNHLIRRITPWGVVTAVAGISGSAGSADGTTNATFFSPAALAVDGASNVYVADTGNHLIRRISASGITSTLAGTKNLAGTVDGLGTAARFNGPAGIAVDAAGYVFVSDTASHTIRFVTPGGMVTTIAGAANSAGSTNALGTGARFNFPRGLAVDANGNLFIADSTSRLIRRSSFVNSPPLFTTEPVANPTALAGGSVTLGGEAGTGYPAVTFQWFKSGALIQGATSPTLTLNNLSTADAATYAVVASNAAGQLTSTDVVLAVGGAPTIDVTAQPAAQQVALGGSATFTVTPTSTIPVTYQWRHNGVAIAGATGSSYTVSNVGLADLGTYDVIITNAGGSITSNPAGLELPGTQDFDGDGNVDLLWQNTVTGERLIWLMDGPTFLSSISLGSITTDWSIAAVGNFGGASPTDLLWQNTVTGERLIWLMNGTTFGSSVSLGIFPRNLQIAGTGDFNADGNSDIVWQNVLTGEVTVTLMNGTTMGTTSSLGFLPMQLQVAGVGDFNGDGTPDILLSNAATGQVLVWLNGTPVASAVSVGFTTATQTVSGAGDLDGDEKADIFLTDVSTGQRSVWQMNGTTIAATIPLTTVPTEWVLNRPIVRRAPADFNGDGNSDVVWQNTSTGDRVIWLMNGTAYQQGFYFGLVAPVWSIAALGDLNGDGQSDILWQNTATGQRVVWLMDNTLFLSGISLGVITTDWTFAGSGDFNGDGKTDILWQNTVTGQRVIWIMNGAQYVSGVPIGTQPTNLQIVGTGDFNGDGKTDILYQNATTHEVRVMLMNGTSIASDVSIGFATANQQVVGTGYFGGDGQFDIVLQDNVTGDRTIWLMNHTTRTSTVVIGTIPLQWSIRN